MAADAFCEEYSVCSEALFAGVHFCIRQCDRGIKEVI